jgi:F-type H+-transporting ATPase subunit epsilon
MTVDIATPAYKFVEGAEATGLKLPSKLGELNILPGHADMITLLGIGRITLTSDGFERHFAVSHGFAEIRRDRVSVLVDTCEESLDIDRTRASEAEKNARAALQGTLSDEEYREQQEKLELALARQQIAERN